MPEINYEKMLFERAARMIKVNGIISIVIGGLATLFLLAYVIIYLFALTTDGSSSDTSMTVDGVVLFLLFLIPSAYTVIAGIVLVRLPRPAVTRGLIIANLVIGAFVNTVGLIFAIISLAQMHDYEVGYKHSK